MIANVVKLNHDYVRNKKIDARLCNAEEKIDLLQGVFGSLSSILGNKSVECVMHSVLRDNLHPTRHII